MGYPLDIAEKIDLLVKKLRLLLIQCGQPLARGLRTAVLLGPVARHFIVVVPSDQGAEERVGFQPLRFGFPESLKLRHPRAASLSTPEIFVPQREQFPLERLHRAVAHRPLAQRSGIVFFGHTRKILFRDIRQPLRTHGQRDRFVGDRTDDIVGAVIRTRFVDGQNLNKPETLLRSPCRQLDERFRVADADIIRPANGAQRREDAADFLFRRKGGSGGCHRVSGLEVFVSCAQRASKASRVRTWRAPQRGQVTVSEASPPKSPSDSRLKTGAMKSSIRS